MPTRIYWAILALLFTECSLAEAPSTQPHSSPTTQVKSLGAISQLEVKGRINVHLHTGYKKPQLILRGDARDLRDVHAILKQDKLILMAQPSCPHFGSIDAEIRAGQLSGFNYKGVGTIIGNRINAPALDLNINNTGITKLGGHLGLRELNISGNGTTQISGAYSQHMQAHIEGKQNVQLHGEVNLANLDINGGSFNLQGANSYNLKIRASNADIQMVGQANWVDLELWGHAHFNGRHFQIKRSFVKTHDRSKADIFTGNHQSTLATDASDIFFYNLPVTRADFMGLNGAVLDMRDWDDPYFCDYSTYNKQFP